MKRAYCFMKHNHLPAKCNFPIVPIKNDTGKIFVQLCSGKVGFICVKHYATYYYYTMQVSTLHQCVESAGVAFVKGVILRN